MKNSLSLNCGFNSNSIKLNDLFVKNQNWIKGLLLNASIGTNGFFKKILFKGIGFKVWSLYSFGTQFVIFEIGLTHYIALKNLYNLQIYCRKGKVVLSGLSSYFVGEFAKRILSLRKLNSYTGRGFSISTLSLKLKVGKRR